MNLSGNLPELVLRHAATHPDRVALRKKHLGRWRTYTWEDYADRVTATAGGLSALGVSGGDRVAVLSDNRPAWLFVDLAAQGLGAAGVGVPPDTDAQGLARVLRDTGATVLVAEDEEQTDKALSVIDELGTIRHVVVVDPRGVDLSDTRLRSLADLEALGRAQPVDLAASAAAVGPDAVATVVLGDGGHAELTHRELREAGASRGEAAGVDDRTELLSTLSLATVDERLLAEVQAVVGGAVVSFGESYETFPQDLREVQPTVFHGPALLWKQIHETAERRMADAGWLKRTTYRIGLANGRAVARRRAPGRRPRGLDGLRYALGWSALYRPLREKLGLLRAGGIVSGPAALDPEVREWFEAIGVPVREALS